jgi:hypothetical protein
LLFYWTDRVKIHLGTTTWALHDAYKVRVLYIQCVQ